MKKNPVKPVPIKVTARNREGGVDRDTEYSVLLHEIREMISSTRNRVAYGVNRETVLLYWNIGARIYKEVLQNERGEYGKKIVETLSGQLSWSHFVELIKIDDDLQRDFYAEMCRIERWSVRLLKAKI